MALMEHDDCKMFALSETGDFGRAVADCLGIDLTEHEERDFEDGEFKIRPLSSVRDSNVSVIQSLHGDEQYSPADKLCRLMLLLGAVRDAAAGQVTAVIPYLCYARKDRKTKSRDPIATRYIAAALESVGIDRIVTLDVHNLAAYQNAFRCHSEHLEARMHFVSYFASKLRDEQVTVVSPDAGGVKRAEQFRESLQAALGRSVAGAFMEKQRSAGIVSGESFVGDVDGRVAIVLDDLISTGTTLTRTAHACRRHGAIAVHTIATHGLFVGDAPHILDDDAIDSVVITNSIPPFRMRGSKAARKLVVLDVAGLVAEAIHRIHAGGSIVDLLEQPVESVDVIPATQQPTLSG